MNHFVFLDQLRSPKIISFDLKFYDFLLTIIFLTADYSLKTKIFKFPGLFSDIQPQLLQDVPLQFRKLPEVII
jgi:hypothetical protein